MVRIHKLVLLLVAFALLQMTSCSSGSSSNRNNEYFQQISNFRAEKDRFFKNDANSPLTEEARNEFDSLYYFPTNTYYRVIAEFVPIPGRATLEVPLNNGQSKTYLRHGFATFTLDSVPNSLLILRSDGGSDLFVPFYDQSNGYETYGGGRYLEALQISDSKILLDFNRAYNPYCAYTPDYVCPLPPRENRLPISISAGEKSFEKY